MNTKFDQISAIYQKKINKEIKNFFEKKINESDSRPFLKKTLRLLKEYSLRPAGRIRATLVNQGYFLAGGKNEEAILKASIFIELIHNYLLIHDDIIDRDNLRRGKPALHCSQGLAMAIELGDMMATLGYEILSLAGFPNNFKGKAISMLNKINYSVCYGQIFELYLREKKIKESDIFEIYRNKTAQYSFIGPLQIGAILAGADDEFLKRIEKFALPLGIAYQITDDISDIKKDIKENQPTLFRKTGSVEYCRKKAENLVDEAKRILKTERKFSEKEKEFLLNLADFILKR